MARPDSGSDNQGAAKPLFFIARPDSDKENQNDEIKSSFQVRKKFMKIIPKIISKGYLLIGEFILFSTRRSSYDLMPLLINTETRKKRSLLRSYRMNINNLPKDNGSLSPLYFYRYALKDLMQEFLYIQMEETQNINPVQTKFRESSIANKLSKTQELFDSDLLKCYKFYL